MEIQTDKPGLAHPPGGQSCLSCHAPHESPVRGLLRDDEHLLACAQCHEPFLDAESQRPYHHRYFDPETQCGNCHYAHQRREQQYLREDVSQMCLTCHTLAIRHQDRYLEQIGWKLNHLPHKHEVMNQGFCQVCHTPHGSDQASLLTAGYPSGSYETYRTEQYSLCWGCHDPQLVESATGLNFTAFRNATENLHRVHVSQMRRGRACHLCHEAHASAQAHLIRPRLKFEKWEASLTWQPLADGGRCLSPCHREKEYHH
jgi:predicted CXXCH cytochrome family protein